MAEICYLEIDMTSFFLSAEGGPIWIKFRRLVQNDMWTAAELHAGPNFGTRPDPTR